MANLQLTQDRSVQVTAEGQTTYVITATVTAPGDLPSTGIFLYNIADPADPKDDSFLRIVSVFELTQADATRALAVSNGNSVFRQNKVTVTSDSIDVALAQSQTIRDRINALIADYTNLTDTFLNGNDPPPFTASVNTTHPSNELSIEDALIEEYRTVKTARKDAETARDTQQASCDSLEEQLALLTLAQTTAVFDRDAFADAVNQAGNADTFYRDLRTSAIDVLNQIKGYRTLASGNAGTITASVGAPSSTFVATGFGGFLSRHEQLSVYLYGNGLETAYTINSVLTGDSVELNTTFTTSYTNLSWELRAREASIDNALTAFTSVLEQKIASHPINLNDLIGSVSGLQTTKADEADVQAGNKRTKDQELLECKTELNKLIADVETAKEAEDAALAAVLELCPDFDPNSIVV